MFDGLNDKRVALDAVVIDRSDKRAALDAVVIGRSDKLASLDDAVIDRSIFLVTNDVILLRLLAPWMMRSLLTTFLFPV